MDADKEDGFDEDWYNENIGKPLLGMEPIVEMDFNLDLNRVDSMLVLISNCMGSGEFLGAFLNAGTFSFHKIFIDDLQLRSLCGGKENGEEKFTRSFIKLVFFHSYFHVRFYKSGTAVLSQAFPP